ncbi:hypothetical protein FCR2A7T_11650 [Flavobacterium cauense R2A-7]|nr:hypothetical protein FCR2A7T_11650 [Flavobacterium cauense R2A-7]
MGAAPCRADSGNMAEPIPYVLLPKNQKKRTNCKSLSLFFIEESIVS